MKEAYWGYWLIALGVFVIVVMMLISNVSATNTQDYYILKEIYEAPPKASIQVTTKSNTYQLNSGAESFDIVNRVDAMLELDPA